MITVLPDKDYEKCPLINSKYSNDTFVFTAKDGEEYLGYGAVIMCETYAEIVEIKCVQGFDMLDHGIGKALLNFVERRGVYHTLCCLKEKESLLKRLGFKIAENEWAEMMGERENVFYLNLEGYFDKHC